VFDSFLGLPLHVLVLHFTVVLVPLGAMATVAVMVRHDWRARFLPHVAAGNVALLALTFVTVRAGLALQGDLDPTRTSVPTHDHEAYGKALLWIVAALAAVSFITWLVSRTDHFAPQALIGLAAVVAVLALASAGMTAVTGHTGSESHWGAISR
jgi:hypothetical protein